MFGATPTAFNFGGTTQPAAAPAAGNLFGGAAPTTPAAGAGGLFGGAAAQSTPVAGASNLTTRGQAFRPSVITVDNTQLCIHNVLATKPGVTLAQIRCADYAAGAAPAPAAAAPAATGLFGGTTTPAAAPAAGGLFGGTTTPAAAPAGGLFGGTTTPAPAGGLFGGATTPAAAPAGGLFGGTTTPAAPAGGGLFGAPATATATTTTAFGTQNPFGAPAAGAAAAPAGTTNLFGTPAAGTTNLFGAAKPAAATAAAPAAGTGLFNFAQPAPSVTPPAGTAAAPAASPFSFSLTPAAGATTAAPAAGAAPAAASPFSFPSTPAAAPAAGAAAAPAPASPFSFNLPGQPAAGAGAPATSLFGAAPQQQQTAQQQQAQAQQAALQGADLPIYGKSPSFKDMKERADRFLKATRPESAQIDAAALGVGGAGAGAGAGAGGVGVGAGERAYVPFVADPRHAFTRSLIRARPRLFDFEVPENRPPPASAALFARAPLAGLGGRALTGLDPSKIARELFPDPVASGPAASAGAAADAPNVAEPAAGAAEEGEGAYPYLSAGSEYSITPSVGELRRRGAAALRRVEGVRIARAGYGWVEFADAVDLTGVDVGAALCIGRSRVESYAPALSGHRVHVHFDCVYPDRVRALAPAAAAAARARYRSKALRTVAGSVVSESGAWDFDTVIAAPVPSS